MLLLILCGLEEFHVGVNGKVPFVGAVDDFGRFAVAPLDPDEDIRVK